MEKVDNMQEKMGNESRERETLRKNKKNGRNQSYSNRNEECFDGLCCRLDMPRIIHLRICREKLLKLKCREIKKGKE